MKLLKLRSCIKNGILGSCLAILLSGCSIDAFLGQTGSDPGAGLNLQLSVEANYSAAPLWLDWLQQDGLTNCTGLETVRGACLHAGEVRRVSTSLVSCSSLSMQDDLAAFDWKCSVVNGQAIFVSSLKTGKGLSDLLDANGFKQNFVTLSSAGTTVGKSAGGVWWGNTIKSFDDAFAALPGPHLTTAAGEKNPIFIVKNSASTAGVSLDSDKIALVGVGATKPVLSLASSANNCSSTGGLGGAMNRTCQITAGSRNFLWVENLSMIEASLFSSREVFFVNVHNYVVRKLSFNTVAGGCLFLAQSTHGFIDQIVATNVALPIYFVISADFNTVKNVRLNAIFTPGIYINQSNDNYIEKFEVSDVNNHGVYIAGLSQRNTFNEGMINNTVYGGIYFNSEGATVGNAENLVYRVVTSSTESAGFNLGGFNSTYLVASTAALSKGGGVNSATSPTSLIHNLASVNTQTEGFLTDTPASISHFAALNNGTGISISAGGAGTQLMGSLVFGGNPTANCSISGASNIRAGANNTSCDLATPSTLYAAKWNASSTNSFVGALTSMAQELTNLFVGALPTAFPADETIFPWDQFDNFFRTWGLAGAWGNIASQGIWAAGSGTIYDLSLKKTDTVLLNHSANPNSINNGGVLNAGGNSFPGTAGAACPVETAGNVFIESAPFAYQASSRFTGNAFKSAGSSLPCGPGDMACVQRYLANAIEILGDGIGDDDGLCEVGETCLYTPNIGAYQGHGSLIECTWSQNSGPISGVHMFGYSSNGR